MRSREWPLIIFTTMTQMAVGSFLVLIALRMLAARQIASEVIDSLTIPAIIAIVPTLAIGALAATFHLSRPFIAFRAIANLGSSGLSREMLLGALFGITVCSFTIMNSFDLGPQAMRTSVTVLASLSGVALVYGLSRAYMLRTVPAWNTPATPISFFITTFLLGILAVALELVVTYSGIVPGDDHRAMLVDALRWSGPTSAVLVGGHLVVIFLNTTYLSTQGGAAAESVKAVFSNHRGLFILRPIMALLGVGMFYLLVRQNMLIQTQKAIPVLLALTAFILVFASEVMGRFLFYASHKRVGL